MNPPGAQTSSENDNSNGEKCQRIDQYGFELSEDCNDESNEEMMSEHLTVLTRRSIKWSALLKDNTKMEKNLKVKRYVRKGVPSEHRALIWMAASGAQQHMEMNCGYYQNLLKAQHDRRLEESIRTDLHRTFPDNIYFRDSSQACLQKALYNVLVTYGHHNKDVGYCQSPRENPDIVLIRLEHLVYTGMNFIAGYLLIITKDEEKSFWLLDALLGRILPDYYTPAMLGLKTDQEVLGELVKIKTPGVWQVVTRHNVMWTLLVSRWFICLYVDVLPMETVLRIWDCLFYEGSKILFRVALTLIRHHQDLLLQAGSLPDVCERFKQLTNGEFVQECHAFMQKIFTEPGRLSMTTITKLRETCRNRIQAQELG